MSFKENFMIFVRYWFPLVILCIAIAGNTLGCIVIRKPKLINIGSRNIYKYLFIFDTFFILQIIVSYIQHANFTGYLNQTSILICKLAIFINYSFAALSPLLIVYISIDRYISIQFPGKRFFLRKENTQLFYFIFVIIYNLIYYIPVIMYRNLIETNSTSNNTTITIKTCTYKTAEQLMIISIMDTINRVLIPFSLMFISSFLLIYCLFKSRTRIVENFLAEENKTFYTEIRLATVSISLNLIFLFLNMPVCVISLFPNIANENIFLYSYYLFYFSYAINFYILLLSNSLFRDEFLNLFKKTKIIEDHIEIQTIN
jgi:hypothetical protein